MQMLAPDKNFCREKDTELILALDQGWMHEEGLSLYSSLL